MKRAFLGLALVLAITGTAISAEAPADQAAKTATNPLKEEMWRLSAAFKGLINSLVLGTPSDVARPFEEVLKSRDAANAALKKGVIWLPKNNNRQAEFMRMDEELHREIKDLIRLSQKGDSRGELAFTHRLLNGCVRCHDVFKR